MNLGLFVTILGAIASVIGLVLPAQSKQNRLIHAAYGLIIVLLSSSLVYYHQKANRIESINVAAINLINNKDRHYTHEGFVNAALVFLEINKDLFPDAYKRATDIFNDNSNDDIIAKASIMKGIIQGIKDINQD